MALGACVTLGEWNFWVQENAGELYISVPDCGGMADCAPRVPAQLAWAEQAFASIPGLQRIWTTSWRIPPEVLPALEQLLRDRGARW